MKDRKFGVEEAVDRVRAFAESQCDPFRVSRFRVLSASEHAEGEAGARYRIEAEWRRVSQVRRYRAWVGAEDGTIERLERVPDPAGDGLGEGTVSSTDQRDGRPG